MTTTYKYSSDRAFRDLLGLLIEEGFESQYYAERDMLQHPEDYRNGYVAIHQEKKTYNVHVSKPAPDMAEWFPGMVLGEVRKMRTEHLTTEEFIKMIEQLGYDTFISENNITIGNKHERHYIATVNKHERLMIDTRLDGFLALDDKARKELWDLLIYYTQSPIEKRIKKKRVIVEVFGELALETSDTSKTNIRKILDEGGYEELFFSIKEVEDE